MKKKLLILSLLFVFLMTNAQYIKMPFDTNHCWKQSWYAYFTYPVTANYNSTYQLKVVKDTIINNKTYCILKRTTTSYYSSNGGYMASGADVFYLRQDTILKRVIILSSSQEYILYNFNKTVGDTAKLFSAGTVSTFTLTYKDSVLLNDGNYHKRYNFGGTGAGNTIEGVGSTLGLVTPYQVGYGNGHQLICMAKIVPSIQTIYSQSGNSSSCLLVTDINKKIFVKDEMKIYPNPTNSILNIESIGSATHLKITNFLGEVIYSTNILSQKLQLNINDFRNGIYFLQIFDEDKLISTNKFFRE